MKPCSLKQVLLIFIYGTLDDQKNSKNDFFDKNIL